MAPAPCRFDLHLHLASNRDLFELNPAEAVEFCDDCRPNGVESVPVGYILLPLPT